MAKKTVIKTYEGKTYVFVPDSTRGYKVSVKGFSTTWYQSNTSVREAKKRSE